MPEAGEGGSRNANVVAIIAVVVLVLIAVFALSSRKPSDEVRSTTTESSTNPAGDRTGGAPPAGDADVDIKVNTPDVDIPDSVTIRTD
jgi:hypothetical protein